jgi:RimJ/RimL family protein N-acetyltransferase
MGDRPFFLNFNVCLTPISLYALEDYQRWFNDSRLALSKDPAVPRTEREIQTWLLRIMKNRSYKYFSILIGGENVGHIGVRQIDRPRKSGELDLFVIKGFSESQGVLEEILSWFKFFTRTNLDLRKLYVRTSQTDEVALKRLLTPAGFVDDEREDGLVFWVDL